MNALNAMFKSGLLIITMFVISNSAEATVIYNNTPFAFRSCVVTPEPAYQFELELYQDQPLINFSLPLFPHREHHIELWHRGEYKLELLTESDKHLHVNNLWLHKDSKLTLYDAADGLRLEVHTPGFPDRSYHARWGF